MPGSVGGPCEAGACESGLMCINGYCVPEDKTDTQAVDITAETDSGGPDIADSGAPDSITRPTPVEGAFVTGGILAYYYADIPTGFDDLGGDPILSRVESELDLNQEQLDFTSINDGKRFAAQFVGGVQIEEAGNYRFSVWAADSVRLTLGGIPLVEFWEAGTLVGGEGTVSLEPGWYPLEILYVRSPYQAHLQVWVERPDGSIKTLGADQLGYDTTLPDDTPELKVDYELGEPTFYAVSAKLTANAPITVSCLDAKGDILYTVETLKSHHSLVVPLLPGEQTPITFTVKDIWGRDQVLALGALTAPELDDFTPGGLLGTYYAGRNFEEMRGQRIDPVVNMPYGAGDEPFGSFGIANSNDNFSVRWEGAIKVETAGEYTLYFGSDDGHRVWFDGILIFDSWVDFGSLVYSEVTLDLIEGWHPITLEMYEANNQAHAYLEWAGPDITPNFIPSHLLGHIPPASDGETPTMTNASVWFGPESTTGHVVIEASEMVTASMKVVSKGSATFHETKIPATSFIHIITDLPNGKNCEEGVFCGPASKIELTLTDLHGNESQEEIVPVVVATPPQGAKLIDDFNGEMLDPAWKTISHGDNDDTPNWIFQNDAITENGNAHGYDDDGLPFYGTFLWNSGWQFTDGRLVAHVFTGDNDGFGLMYGIQNEGIEEDDPKTWSYYRFSVNYETPPARMVRCDKGKFTVLEENADYRPPLNRWIMIEIERVGDVHTAIIDGLPLFKFADAKFASGSIGIYSWAMTGFMVDFVAIDTL
jgi:hypothetical protein